MYMAKAHSFWPQRLSQKRMTIEDYQRNLRGVNDGSDFSPEYLVSGRVNVSGPYHSRSS
jgi:hypothetical protein